MILKIRKDKATGILVVPLWETQAWYAELGKILIDCPVILTTHKALLSLPASAEKCHRRAKSLNLTLLQSLRKRYKDKDISEQSAVLLSASWREGTVRNFDTYISKWKGYTDEENISFVSHTFAEATVLNFCPLCSETDTGTVQFVLLDQLCQTCWR